MLVFHHFRFHRHVRKYGFHLGKFRIAVEPTMLNDIKREVKKLNIDKKWKKVKEEKRRQTVPYTRQGSKVHVQKGGGSVTGTLGGFAKLEIGNNSQLVALTASHLAQTGETVLVEEGGIMMNLGNVEYDTHEITHKEEYHDLSVIVVDPDFRPSPMLQYYFSNGRGCQTADVYMGSDLRPNQMLQVFKRGAATNLTHGIVCGYDWRPSENKKNEVFRYIKVLGELDKNSVFSDRGDSGSLVCCESYSGSGTKPHLMVLASVYKGPDYSSNSSNNAQQPLDLERNVVERNSSLSPPDLRNGQRTRSEEINHVPVPADDMACISKWDVDDDSNSSSDSDCTECVLIDRELDVIRTCHKSAPNLAFDLRNF